MSNGNIQNGNGDHLGNSEGTGPTWLPVDSSFATAAIHSGYVPKDWSYAPVVPSISLSTTFEQDAPAQHRVIFAYHYHILSSE